MPYSPINTDIFSDQAGQFVLMESRSLTNREQGVKVQTRTADLQYQSQHHEVSVWPMGRIICQWHHT